MAKLEPKMDADGVNALLRRVFPGMNQAETRDRLAAQASVTYAIPA